MTELAEHYLLHQTRRKGVVLEYEPGAYRAIYDLTIQERGKPRRIDATRIIQRQEYVIRFACFLADAGEIEILTQLIKRLYGREGYELLPHIESKARLLLGLAQFIPSMFSIRENDYRSGIYLDAMTQCTPSDPSFSAILEYEYQTGVSTQQYIPPMYQPDELICPFPLDDYDVICSWMRDNPPKNWVDAIKTVVAGFERIATIHVVHDEERDHLNKLLDSIQANLPTPTLCMHVTTEIFHCAEFARMCYLYAYRFGDDGRAVHVVGHTLDSLKAHISHFLDVFGPEHVLTTTASYVESELILFYTSLLLT